MFLGVTTRKKDPTLVYSLQVFFIILLIYAVIILLLLTDFISRFINSNNKYKKDSNIDNQQIFNDAQNQFGVVLQQMFKTITNITIFNNKVSKNYSLLFGGELYFILCEFI